MAHMHDTPRRIIAAAVTLLLLCVVHYAQGAHAATTNDFTAEQRTHTERFLKGFLSGATQLQSEWTGTDFCGWSHVSCPDATTVNVDWSWEWLGSNVTLAELSDEVDGSQVMVRELRLQFHESSLSGTLPESWARLTQLRVLDLLDNKISGTLPAVWGSMTALTVLYLNSNELSGTLPASWGSMTSLQKLSLRANSLTGSLPAAWRGMRSIQLLDLATNRFLGTLPAEFGGMKALTKMYMNSNQLTGTLPNEWASMGSLQELSLRNNSLSGPLPEAWGSLPANSKLYVTDNEFCGCVPSSWSSLERHVDQGVAADVCATANACTAPAKPSVRNFTALWAVLGLLGGCVSIAGVVVAVVLYRRRATAAAATAEERGDIKVVSDTSSCEPYAGAGNKTE